MSLLQQVEEEIVRLDGLIDSTIGKVRTHYLGERFAMAKVRDWLIALDRTL